MAGLGWLDGQSRSAGWPVSGGSMASFGRLDGRPRVARWPVSVGSMVCLSWLDGQFQWALWPVLRGSVAVHRTHRSAPVLAQWPVSPNASLSAGFGSVASVSERIAQHRSWPSSGTGIGFVLLPIAFRVAFEVGHFRLPSRSHPKVGHRRRTRK
jgi:hypothetical protein